LVGNCNITVDTKIKKAKVRILLVEDNSADARLLKEVLKATSGFHFNLCHVQRLEEAIANLCVSDFEIVLLDLTLPDSQGLASLDVLLKQAPNLPIVVLTHTKDDDLAIRAVRHGAQDYLVKRELNQDLLIRSLNYAIERKQTEEALREAKEILESRVKERTAELESANALLTQEIERRQKIQERLELAQQVGNIGTFEWYVQTQKVIWTAELEALYGVVPGSFDGRYDDWFKTIHSEDSTRVEKELWEAVEAEGGLNTEFRIIRPNGEVRWIVAKGSVFRDKEGNPLRMLGVHIDITDKKQLEAQFLRAQRLESLGTLASGIAHDLNNILTPILAVSQLLPLKLQNLDDRERQMLKILEASARRGSDLVKQILSFARGVEGKRICLQVSHVLLEIKKIVEQTLPKSIAIELEIAPNLWTICADATQLHQIFMNLCVNARDAMSEGGILTITAENISIDEQYIHQNLEANVGSYVLVIVSDLGNGIPPEILPRIFDPFFTTKEIGKGTGLGLSAVLGIVKSHGGFVEVETEIGKGSKFKVFLPASESPVVSEDEDLVLLAGNNELILIVDDEAAVCEILKTTLETYNYRVLTAKEGTEAIALFAEHKDVISAVVMDIMMPTMDGLVAIPLLRRFNPHIYAIAMSGLTSKEAISQAEKLGFQAFLPKPFATKDLLKILQVAGNLKNS
jgi:PAS domain S-box-containing protein